MSQNTAMVCRVSADYDCPLTEALPSHSLRAILYMIESGFKITLATKKPADLYPEICKHLSSNRKVLQALPPHQLDAVEINFKPQVIPLPI